MFPCARTEVMVEVLGQLRPLSWWKSLGEIASILGLFNIISLLFGLFSDCGFVYLVYGCIMLDCWQMGTLGWRIVDVLWGFLLDALMMSLDYMRILDVMGLDGIRVGILLDVYGNPRGIRWDHDGISNAEWLRVLQMMLRECWWIWIVNMNFMGLLWE